MCAGQIDWDYDRAEIIADGIVHAISVCLGLIGAVTIVVIAARIERIEVAPILVYVIGLVTMLALSAAYNSGAHYQQADAVNQNVGGLSLFGG